MLIIFNILQMILKRLKRVLILVHHPWMFLSHSPKQLRHPYFLPVVRLMIMILFKQFKIFVHVRLDFSDQILRFHHYYNQLIYLETIGRGARLLFIAHRKKRRLPFHHVPYIYLFFKDIDCAYSHIEY